MVSRKTSRDNGSVGSVIIRDNIPSRDDRMFARSYIMRTAKRQHLGVDDVLNILQAFDLTDLQIYNGIRESARESSSDIPDDTAVTTDSNAADHSALCYPQDHVHFHACACHCHGHGHHTTHAA